MSTPPTLLLADDSVAIQRLIALSFADQPVRLVVAKDGQDAINRMATDPPDLVLADTNMPCVDGYELARWVRQQPALCAVPVLLLAGVTDPVDEQRLHDSGANGVLEKPFEPTHVISRVKELLGMKSAAPAPPTRLVTAPDTRATPPARPSVAKLATPPVEPTTVAPAAAAPPPVLAQTIPSPVAVPDRGATARLDELFGAEALRADASLDDMFASVDARLGKRDDIPSLGDQVAAAGGDETRGRSLADLPPVVETDTDWFATATPAASQADLMAEMGVSDAARDLGLAGPRRATSAGMVTATVNAPLATQGAADVFESLLAAEQGDGPADDRQMGTVVVQAAAPELTDQMMDLLATRVVERLSGELRDDLARGLAATLHDSLARTVQASVDAAVRAAVADAVAAQMATTVREVVAVQMATIVREAVAAQVPSSVRESVEREVRDTVAPLVDRSVRDLVGPAVQLAVAESVPAAVQESVRGEVQGLVRETVADTSERLVRDEIARIRERRA